MTHFPAFRVKIIDKVRVTSEEERKKILRDCNYNLFGIKAKDVMLDFLTDSGTGALSAEQAAAMQLGDESYAGSESWFKFEKSVRYLFDFKYIIPTHQGRAAERILFTAVGGKGKIIPNNTHFDTTRANVECTGAKAIDLPIKEGKETHRIHPFKGNMDIKGLQKLLQEKSDKVPLVIVTITNNSGGGQPVSMENLYSVRAVCQKYGIPVFLDACRFAENAWFIKEREREYEDKSITEIVREMASLVDGMTMSAKKDGLAHIGGWLAMNNNHLAEQCTENLILTEGFTTYGGLSGKDLEVIAQGLKEVVEEDYLRERVGQIQYFGQGLIDAGVPVLQPIGGHAVYIDAGKLLSHIPPLSYPGHALAVELYREAGIRGCEIGTVMFGRQTDNSEKPAAMELVRLAVPRRLYTQRHIDYAIQAVKRVAARASAIQGMDDACAGIQSLQTSIEIELCQNPWNGPHTRTFITEGNAGVSCCECKLRDQLDKGPVKLIQQA